MNTREDYAEYWMGVDAEGGDIGIHHNKLMLWAAVHGRDDDLENIEANNNWIDPQGARLVRGKHIAEARKMGWDDIADMLEAWFTSKGL